MMQGVEMLISGGAGFFGSILAKELANRGFQCVVLDRKPCPFTHTNLKTEVSDLRDARALEELFSSHHFSTVFHCAAVLAHGHQDSTDLWESNVLGTRLLAQTAARYNTQRLIFTSSNCVWGRGFDYPVSEDVPPEPIELYGRSKLEGEKELERFKQQMIVCIVRCPTIIDAGRLGLLAILFEFIEEGRRVWTVGPGDNRYQFVYAADLADACIRLATYSRSDLFHIGSDSIRPMREVYEYVIRKAGSRSRVTPLPRSATLLAMKLAYHLGISPLGPYHYKMISENFVFDTTKIKQQLGWRPTLNNEEMLAQAYEYYIANRNEIASRQNVSDHRKAADMGIIRLLKWLS